MIQKLDKLQQEYALDAARAPVFCKYLVVCNTYSYRLVAAGCESGAAAKAAVSEQKTTFFCEAVLPLQTKF